MFIHLDNGPVRTWTLDSTGLGDLLLHLRRMVENGHLNVSPRGELLGGRARRPLTVGQRLAFHRMIAKAEFLARTR